MTAERRARALAGLSASYRHELRLLLYAPVTYLYQVGFLALLAVCVFLVSDYYNQDEATIESMLSYLPWLALLLVPALAMRCWPSDQEDRSTELLLTLPIALPALVAGKFLAGFTVLCLTLAFTVALPATAAYLGEPDGGAIAAGYLGAALLMASYYALSLFAAALTREPLAAFVVSVAVIAGLLLLGWEAAGRELHGVVPADILAALPLFSPAQNLSNIGRGLIDAASLGYFLLVILVALVATGLLVAARRHSGRWQTLGRGTAIVAVSAAVLILAVPGTARVPWSLDLTDEREFSLGEGTRDILGQLPAGVEVTLYWSASQANVPASIKAHARRILDLLRVMAVETRAGLAVRLVDPLPDSEEELEALRAGIRRVPMSSGDVFYLGAVVGDGERIAEIPYFDARRAGLLEYDLALAFEGLSRPRTPKVAVLSPHLPPATAAQAVEDMSFLGELRKSYDLAIIPFFAEEIPADLDTLLLVDPALLKKRTLFAIDQYLMAGGSVIVLIDPYLRAKPQSAVALPAPSEEIDDISDLLFAYGIGYDSGAVVGDAAVAAQVRDQEQMPLTYPYWLRLRDGNLPGSHPVTAGLNELLLVEPGAFTIEEQNDIRPLIISSESSDATDRAAFAQATPRERTLAFESDGAQRVLAVARQGLFDSAYASPPDDAEQNFLPKSRAPGVLFAVADVDWIFDGFAAETRSIGDETIVRPLNDNIAFLLNLVSYASGNDALIGIRNRGRIARNFTRVEELFRAAEAQLREEEAALTRTVAELEGSLLEMLEAGDGTSGESASAAWRERIGEQQADLLAARRALRQIRSEIRQQVDELGRTLILLNILSGPLLVLLLFGAALTLRRFGQRGQASPPVYTD